jgi:DNA-binding transcriptional MocR family regulator
VNVPKHYQKRPHGSNAIASQIERDVAEGRLAPGERLPTVRALAKRLDASAGTVAAAYRVLQTRGVIVSAGRRGTVVRPLPPVTREVPATSIAAGLRNLADGNPDARLLPSLAKALRAVPREHVLYGCEPHDAALLERAARSFKADGLGWSAVAVVGGALDGIERALAAQLRPGDRVAVEDPVYSAHLDLLAALGLVAEPVRIDERGMRPDALAAAIRHGARALIHSPRAQNPTGAALDQERQAALRGVLSKSRDLFIIEDDHAWLVSGADYRTVTAGAPRWFAVRSFSKAFGPDLRIAIASGDPITISRIKARQRIGAGWVSHVLQSVALSLWTDGEAMEHITGASRAYAQRRNALVGALARHGITVAAPSGLNCWIPVGDEIEAIEALRRAGFEAAPGARFRIAASPAIRVTIASLPPRDADAIARALSATRMPHTAGRTA